ncbi:MAG: hypothetical protein KF716_14700 [Anaerolineae bacterium]|nr:hypothetical protein [Anaerolineae bacterium]
MIGTIRRLFTSPRFAKTWLPIGLTIVALGVLNYGLYFRLAPKTVKAIPSVELPFTDVFESGDRSAWTDLGGSWQIVDNTLVQTSPTGYDLGTAVNVKIAETQPYQVTVSMKKLSDTLGGGLLLNMQETGRRQQSIMTRFNVDAGALYLIYGYYDATSGFVGQGSTKLDIPTDFTDWIKLSAQVGTDKYQLAVNDKIAAADIPLQFKGGGVGLITSVSSVAFDNYTLQAWSGDTSPAVQQSAQPTSVAEVSAPTAVPVAIGNKPRLADHFDQTGNAEGVWLPISGTWVFDNTEYVQKDTNGFDLTSVYYDPLQSTFRLAVQFRHLQGTGGGVLFNMPARDSKNGAHMVRYVADGLSWGYFDSTGVFQGQGYANTALPETASHILEVTSDGVNYAIHLDGALIVEGVKLMSSGGYFGLTTSQSSVAFKSVEVFDAGTVPTSNVQPTATSNTAVELSVSSGQWTTKEGVITQNDAASVDSITGVGVSAETFRASAEISLPDLPDAGGGLLFYMSERDNPALGYMVRLGQGGKELFWGTYDAQRVFVGAGSIPLDVTTDKPIKLEIGVHRDSYDIYVNGKMLVNQLPFNDSKGAGLSVQRSGWLGLISFRGPVQFTNLQLTLGGE